jgi:hypothetical protein
VRNTALIALGLGIWMGLAGFAGAMTFELTDGRQIEGDVVQGKPEFLQIRTEGTTYEKISWDKLAQSTLKQLLEDPRLRDFAQPYIEIPIEDIVKKTEVPVKPVPRIERPPQGSVLGALFSSSVGLVMLLLVYGANIYAAYEVSIIRAYPAGMVCGVAAVAPIIGPAVFLFLPTKLKSTAAELEEAAADAEAAKHSASYNDSSPLAPEPGQAAAPHSAYSIAHPEAGAKKTTANLPPAQVFKRGQFTFNRRFIETKFAGFFGMVRRDAEKDLVMIVKCARGEFVVTRISRIATNDLHVDVHRSGASQEVQIPFVEIQEIQVKHKDA